MTTPLQLPYFRNAKELPAPVPTTSEILASKDIIKGIETSETRKVVGVGPHFIVKYSRSNEQIEGENLLFLERNQLDAFAPRLYAMWKESDGTLFLVMERLRGKTLEVLWPTLPDVDKESILVQTRAILTQIRSIPQPGFFGSVDRSYLPHYLFYWPKYPSNFSGPFTTERALIEGLVANSRATAQDNQRPSYLADFFDEQLKNSGLAVEGRIPVFTHSDLQRKNILVEEVVLEGGKQGNRREFRVALVDWESAGWYPVYWEYFTAFLGFRWMDDWASKVVWAVDAWAAEAVMMRMIHQDLWMCFEDKLLKTRSTLDISYRGN